MEQTKKRCVGRKVNSSKLSAEEKKQWEAADQSGDDIPLETLHKITWDAPGPAPSAGLKWNSMIGTWETEVWALRRLRHS